MKTLKSALRHNDEMQNLKTIGLCYLIITLLIVGSFGLSNLAFLTESPRNTEQTVSVSESLEIQ
jgi:hypothetical protein